MKFEFRVEDYYGDGEVDWEIEREVAERHAEEDRLERERCEQDEAYASERFLREMGG